MSSEDQINQPNAALPEPGRTVNDQVLYSNGLTAMNALRFYGGIQDPALVWNLMISESREVMRLYRELEMKDDTVGDAVEEMKRSVLRREISVVPVEEGNAQAQEIADFVMAQFNGLPSFRNTLDALMDAPFYGFAVSEQVFDVSSGQVALLDIRDCPQELFSFAEKPWLPQTGPLRLHTSLADYDGTPVPENKFITWSSRMRAGNRRGRPLLREVYSLSWILRNVIRLWLRLVERGPGTAVTSYNAGGGEAAETAAAQQALKAAIGLVENTAMAVPESMIIRDEFLKAARSTEPQAWAQLADLMESKIIRRIVGSTLTSKGSDGGKGTQALGKVHENTKDERSVEFALQLQDVLNRQVVQQLVLWNFGPDAPAVRLVIDTSDEEDLGAKATVYDTVQGMGLELSKKDVYKTFGVAPPDGDDDILQRPAAPAPTSLTTPAGPPDAPQFADTGGDPTITRQVHREQGDFDKLFNAMKSDGVDVYRKRIRQIADATQRW